MLRAKRPINNASTPMIPTKNKIHKDEVLQSTQEVLTTVKEGCRIAKKGPLT